MAQADLLNKTLSAFGEIKFGMSRDTVQAIKKQTLNRGKSKVLGAYEYTFVPTFNDIGQLYLLQLQSESESAFQLESSVRAKVANLKQIISTKCGEPKKSFGFPDDFALVETNRQWTNVLEFDTKTIRVGVQAIP